MYPNAQGSINFTTLKIWWQSRCSLTDEWIKKKDVVCIYVQWNIGLENYKILPLRIT